MTRTETELFKIARKEGFIPNGCEAIKLNRTYAGQWQRIGGAWSWFVTSVPRGDVLFGSYDTAKECIQAYREGRVVFGKDVSGEFSMHVEQNIS
jgi:hypothetical protein